MSIKISKLENFRISTNKQTHLKTINDVDFTEGDNVFISNINDKDVDSLKNNIFYQNGEYPFTTKSYKVLDYNKKNIIINHDIDPTKEITGYYINTYQYIKSTILDFNNIKSSFIANCNIIDSSINSGYVRIYKENIIDNFKILGETVIIQGEDNLPNIGERFKKTTSKIYNSRIEKGTIYNCYIKNYNEVLLDKREEKDLIKITGGKFYNCIIEDYIIEGGEFYDCILRGNCEWVNGLWDDSTNGWDIEKIYELNLDENTISKIVDNKVIDIFSAFFEKDKTSLYIESLDIIYGDLVGKDFDSIFNILRNCTTFKLPTWNDGLFKNGNCDITNWNNGVVMNGDLRIYKWKMGELKRNGVLYVKDWLNGIVDGGTIKSCYNFVEGDIISGNLDGEYIKDISGTEHKNITKISNCVINGGYVYKGRLINCILKNGLLKEISELETCTSFGGTINGCNLKNAHLQNTDLKNSYHRDGNGIIIENKTINTTLENVILTNCRLYDVSITKNTTINYCYFERCEISNPNNEFIEIIKSTFNNCYFNEDVLKLVYLTVSQIGDENVVSGFDKTKFDDYKPSKNEIRIKDSTIKNSRMTFCNLYDNEIIDSNIYISDFYNGSLYNFSFNDGNWYYGIFIEGIFNNSIWNNGLYKDVNWVSVPNIDIPQKPKRIETYIK